MESTLKLEQFTHQYLERLGALREHEGPKEM